jgi:two-component system CheB/CheR fusion protein
VVIRVQDSGMGIPPQSLSRVFDLFTQVHRSLDRIEGGLGIGLTLVQRLVELHGGRVSANSQGPGQGSEFVVRLPVADGALTPLPHSEGDALPPLTKSFRMLVIDDNTDAAESLALLLRNGGQEVMTAHDGRSGLEAARSHHPEVVILDIGLPGMDGYEVAHNLRRESGLEGLLLVALSGYGQVEDRRRAAEAGFDHHLTKPIAPRVLFELLANNSKHSGDV